MQESPTHRALFIDEILAAVLIHIRINDRNWRPVTPYKTLARLALSCRSFTEPALNVLWARQTSLMPLLRVFPTFCTHSGDFSYDDPIADDHWIRFQQYAARIHAFVYCRHVHLSCSVFNTLAQKAGDSPLLPSLCHLVWKQTTSDDPAASLFRLSPLRDVYISPYEIDYGVFDESEHLDSNPSHAVLLFLNSVVTETSPLQRLVLAGPFPDSCKSVIPQLKSLRQLDLGMAGAIDHDLLSALSSMTTLSDLSFHTRGLRSANCLARPAFRSLESCILSGSALSICAVLEAIDSSSLHSVSIVASRAFTPADILSCTSMLQRKFTPCLRSVHMRASVEFLVSERVGIMSMLEPLLGLALIEDLHLDFDEQRGHLRVYDQDVEAMVSAWSHLRHFHLWHHSAGDDPSLQSLALFATHCPNLRDVALVVSVGPSPDLSPAPALPHHLRDLRLLGNVSLPHDPKSVAPYICMLFPKLIRFNAFAWESHVNRKWAAIRRSILRRTANGTLEPRRACHP
ncbi:hypothetical protein B0H21DRAFT_819261 [Amylocystis lapponica]|nr:hypothetical protein B0H21DRAFT_819261 [Amylocystis lapponica]